MPTPIARLLFAGTIFSSAFLLFLVQPLIAKQILPWFGGSAAVWTVCMVFFQVLLLLGYAYADWISRHLVPRSQMLLHGGLLVASLLFLPIIASSYWKPGGNEDPTVWILFLLSATIGLPYLLLSTTGPLVQSWVARTALGTEVYRYFSLSNLASLLALVCYPFLIEPVARLRDQAVAWSAVYAVFAALCVSCAVYFARHAKPIAPVTITTSASPPAGAADKPPLGAARVSNPQLRDYLLWLALSAMGSWVLLAITNHITQNVAAIPFLWLLPLTLYLLTFVLCFESDRWYRRRLFVLPTTALLLQSFVISDVAVIVINIKVWIRKER